MHHVRHTARELAGGARRSPGRALSLVGISTLLIALLGWGGVRVLHRIGHAPATSGPPVGPLATLNLPQPDPSLYQPPSLAHPVRSADPGLVPREPRPAPEDLRFYLAGSTQLIHRPGATPTDWQLANPDPAAVTGYAGSVSVAPGQSVDLHLSGRDPSARLDVFRIGALDAQHVFSTDGIRVMQQPQAGPRAVDGLVEESWPTSYQLRIPVEWRSGVYLAKLTGTSGGGSYVLFIVRPTTSGPLLVVVPMTTYEAYNTYGGASLYDWPGGLRSHADRVSFDRPFDHQAGAGLFFRFDFPLIVWLEDHGYSPTYVADTDLATNPGLATAARTILLTGHSEYWTSSMRDALDAAAANGAGLGFFGANDGFWQVRLEPDASGQPARTVVCYKDAARDPMAALDPRMATVRFASALVKRPPRLLLGEAYGGIVDGIAPLLVGRGITAFAPDAGLRPGELLPAMIGGEVDRADTHDRHQPRLLLGETPVIVHEQPQPIFAGMSLWARPAGGRIFDAGTFTFAWGLDPRYAAALPGFPADPFADLTARILAWLGAQPR